MLTQTTTQSPTNGAVDNKRTAADLTHKAFEIPQGVDPVPLQRDERGNRRQFYYYTRREDFGYSAADQAKLAKLLATARERGLHGLADLVEHVHDDCLVPAQLRVHDLRREMARDLEALRELSIRREKECEAREEEIDKQLCAELEALVVKREPARKDALQADLKAAESFAEAGAVFNPEQPSESDLLAVARKSEDEMAAELRLPVVRDVPLKDVAKFAVSFAGLVVGIPFGISLLIATGIMGAQKILDGEGLRVVFGMSLIGAVIMTLLGAACTAAFRVAAQATYSGAPRASRFSLYSIAFSVLVASLAIESSVELLGILKLSSQKARLGEQGTPLIVALCIGLVVAFGFLVLKSYLGYLDGQRRGVDSVLKGRIEQDLAARTKERREQPEVQRALQDLAEVRATRQTLAEHDRRIADRKARFDGLAQQNASRRIPYPLDYSPTQKLLLEEAVDRVVFPNEAFVNARARLERALEVKPNFQERLTNAFNRRFRKHRQSAEREGR